ncbi:MAG: RICIN domain-containing protein [Bacteroidota bacterium]
MKTQLLTSKPGWFILTFCFVFHMAYSQNAPLFNAGADPKPNGKKWALVTALSDEFNGGSLNKNKWDANPEFIFKGQNRGWYGSQRSLFEEDNATVTNGQLRIENEKFPSPRYSPKDDRSKPAVRKYGGAYVHGKTLAKPGYYMEARMRAANTAMSAAFWLKTEPIPCADLPIGENLELDIQECVGIMTGELGDNWTKDDWAVNAQWDRIFHYNTHRHTQCFNGSQQTKGGKINHGLNRNAFHVYGAYWRAGGNRIDFYHNGKLVRSVTPPIPFQGEMRLIMSSNFYDWIEEIGAGAMGFNNSKADRSVKFDWVRTWRLVDSGGNNASGSVFHITNRATDDRIRTDGTATDGLLEHVTNAWAGAPTKWTTINTSGGYFYLRNEENGMYFRPKDDSNGSPIVQVPSSYTGAYTQWRKVTSSNGYFYLQNKATGMYMRPSGENKLTL